MLQLKAEAASSAPAAVSLGKAAVKGARGAAGDVQNYSDEEELAADESAPAAAASAQPPAGCAALGSVCVTSSTGPDVGSSDARILVVLPRSVNVLP